VWAASLPGQDGQGWEWSRFDGKDCTREWMKRRNTVWNSSVSIVSTLLTVKSRDSISLCRRDKKFLYSPKIRDRLLGSTQSCVQWGGLSPDVKRWEHGDNRSLPTSVVKNERIYTSNPLYGFTAFTATTVYFTGYFIFMVPCIVTLY